MHADPLNHRLSPGGETHTEVQDRMARALTHLARTHPGADLIVIGHGIAMRTLAWRLLGGPHTTFRTMPMPNLGTLTTLVTPTGTITLTDPQETATPRPQARETATSEPAPVAE